VLVAMVHRLLYALERVHLNTVSWRAALPICLSFDLDANKRFGEPFIARASRGDRAERPSAVTLDREAGVDRDGRGTLRAIASRRDRKSTRLNSSHVKISYAVFWLKKKAQAMR